MLKRLQTCMCCFDHCFKMKMSFELMNVLLNISTHQDNITLGHDTGHSRGQVEVCKILKIDTLDV